MSQRDDTELRDMASSKKKAHGCCGRNPVCCGTTLLAVGLLAGAAVIALGASYQAIHAKLDSYIQHQVVLKKGSAATDNWANSKAPLYTKFYFFTVTNYKDVENGASPNVRQMGPYTYREYRIKHDMAWSKNDAVVTYNQNTTYVFEPSLSVGDPKHAHIRTINLPLFGVLEMIESVENDPSRPSWEKEMVKVLGYAVDEFIKFTKVVELFYDHTVDELLWGYTDPLLKFLKKFPIPNNPITTDRFNLSVKSVVDTNFSVYTGIGDLSKVGQYIWWEGRPQISEWGTPAARMLNGTAGFLFHPGVSKKEQLDVFISEIYRSGFITYQQELSRHGIPVYRFAIPGIELNASFQDPGFYPGAPSGVLNMTVVAPNNIPFFAAKPHFLDADPVYRRYVTGMSPNRSIHDSTIDIEPLTGTVMGANKRIQLNIQLKKYSHLPELKHLQPVTYLPVYYGSEEGGITDSLASDFKSEVFLPRNGINGALIAVIALAGLVFIVCLLCLAGLIIQQRRKTHVYRRSKGGVHGRQSINSSADETETSPLLDT